MALWKSVENFMALGVDRAVDREPLKPGQCREPDAFAQCLRACSACDGDYEDPDRTARMPDEEEEDFASEKAQDKGQENVETDAGVDEEDQKR